jgi:hypothetical protein
MGAATAGAAAGAGSTGFAGAAAGAAGAGVSGAGAAAAGVFGAVETGLADWQPVIKATARRMAKPLAHSRIKHLVYFIKVSSDSITYDYWFWQKCCGTSLTAR